MKIEGYEEISCEEWNRTPTKESASFQEGSPVKSYYFKKVQKFPIVFEDEDIRIEVQKLSMKILDKKEGDAFVFHYAAKFPLLVKAIEKAKEVLKK